MAERREGSERSNKSGEEGRSGMVSMDPSMAGTVPVKAEVGGAATTPAVQKQVSLKVVNADGAEMFFKIKRGTPLRKLFDAYCNRQSIARNSIRFLFEGMVIDESSTPDSLKMVDDDIIDAMVEQTGGGIMN